MKLMTGNANLPLARAISADLGLPLTDALVRRFADEEIFVEVRENVRGEDVFVLQSTGFPANDNLMELLIMIDALKRASAKRITAVIPYFGYARQDRKPGPRTPISAKLVANLITVAGADRVLSVDLHAGQIQGFFDIPTDNLYAAPVIGDAGFENSPVGTGYVYNPSGSSWTFTGNAGLTGNNNAFTSANPAAPQGTQVAFLQDQGVISQSITASAAGTYTLSLLAAQRGNFGTSTQTFEVVVDGSIVATIRPTSTTYAASTTAAFALAAGTHTISFVGLNPAGGDNTAFLDNVTLASA